MNEGSCPACNKSYSAGWTNNQPLNEIKINLIATYLDTDQREFCDSCGREPYGEARRQHLEKLAKAHSWLQQHAFLVPVVTLHSLPTWDFDVIGMVTGQSTTGTGVISELFSDFTDFFGKQSGAFNSKLKQGEELCTTQLRLQALKLGANAVVGVDIDYSELGGGKGMIMVCMTGTAVHLKNTEVLGQNFGTLREQLAMNGKVVATPYI